ncbi:MAG: chemotaxis protein CheX [Gammaproteobacteria bacterium]|nr:chemotaxis protein CheX [Gammaproteobacteria bacterium]
MQDQFINSIQESIINVLVTMADMQPETGKPSVKTSKKIPGDVTGIIGLVSKQKSGSLAISFTKPVALEIARRMLRMEINTIDEMVRDLVGEIANMMAGGAKAKLQEEGYDFELTFPSVIVESENDIIHNNSASTIILPFETDSGEFFVELYFKEDSLN